MGLHIGIIMDGNGRWATAQGKPRLAGHEAGIEAVHTLVKAAPKQGVDSITLFAFAVANWRRDKEEVEGLWKLFESFFKTHIAELISKGVCVKVIGDRVGLPVHIQKLAQEAEERSKDNESFLLQIALNYDGVDEVARLVKRVLNDGVKAEVITSDYVRNHLDTVPHTEPDIVIRTGMPAPEKGMAVWRSSAFLPIQSAQSVCVSTEVLWPDFTPEQLAAVIAYADPEARLFGGQRV